MTHLVCVNRALPNVAGVLTDTTQAMRQVAQHLYGLGHVHLAYVNGPAASWGQQAAPWGSLTAARAMGISVAEFESGAPDFKAGAAVAAQLATSGATAVVAYNDLLALGSSRASRAWTYRCRPK